MFRLSTERGMVEGKSRFSREVSSESSERGQERPAFSARSRYSLIVVRPTPQLWAACRADRPLAQQRRNTSLIFLMDNLVFATFAPYRFRQKRTMALSGIYPASLKALSRVAGPVITGGRFGSYWLAGLHHNGWPDSIIFGGRFGPEYAQGDSM